MPNEYHARHQRSLQEYLLLVIEPIRQNRSVDKYHRFAGPADIILDVRAVQLYSFHSWRSSHLPRACAMRRVSAVCCRRPTLPSRNVQKWANRDCTLRPFFVTPK